MDDKQFAILLDKLEKIIRLQAIDVVRGLPLEKDKIGQLDTAGFKATEIDRILGKTPGYSRVVLERLKDKKQPKPPDAASAPSTIPVPDEVVSA